MKTPPRGMVLGVVMTLFTVIVIAAAILLTGLATHQGVRRRDLRHDQLGWLARSAARNGLPRGLALEQGEPILLAQEMKDGWSIATASAARDRVEVRLQRGRDGAILEWSERHER